MRWTEEELKAVRKGIKMGIEGYAWNKVFPYRTFDSIFTKVSQLRQTEKITPKQKRDINWDMLEVKEESCRKQKGKSPLSAIRM